MSDDPTKFNFGRFVAAERNARTAALGVHSLESKISDVLQRTRKIEAEIVRVKQENAALKGQLYALRGSGPTA